jgi:hypothetical protein
MLLPHQIKYLFPFDILKNLNPLIVRIRDINSVILVDEYAGGEPKLSVSMSRSTERHQQPEFFIEYLDIVKKSIHHIDIPITVNRYSPWS